jgi:hypothetical protein
VWRNIIDQFFGPTAPRLVLAGVLCTFVATAAAAQDPVPPPPVPVPVPEDTLGLPEPREPEVMDTVPAPPPVVADTLLRAPDLPSYTRLAPVGYAVAAWEWQGETLHRLRGTTLLELLAQVPGLQVTRPHGFGQPAGVAAFGLGGGRVRVFRDGFELDPLSASLMPLQHIAVADLEGVRVVRDLHETRIELTSYRLPHAQPQSAIEAGTGAPVFRLLRGMFARPVSGRSSALLSFDLVDTEGPLAGPPSTLGAGAVRWTYAFTPSVGAEVEFRQTSTDFGEGPYTQDFGRRELLLRSRAAPLPGAVVEATAGRVWRLPSDADSLQLEGRIDQAVLRASYAFPMGWVEGSGRLRSQEGSVYPAPTSEVALAGGVQPLPMAAASGSARFAGGEMGGTELSATLRVGPVAGLSAFASIAAGTRGIAALHDTVHVREPVGETADTLVRVLGYRTFESELNASRIGAEWSRGSLRIGSALVRSEVDNVVPFGLPFDAAVQPPFVEAAHGIEGFASIPLGGAGLRFEGSFTRWSDAGFRPYLPLDQGRGALVFHNLYYTDNLEPTVRVEAVYRGSSLVPTGPAGTFEAAAPGYTLVNVSVQIRVIDVRAFLVVENLLNEQAAMDIPGAPIGPRAHYGVRWHFRN